MSPIEQGLIPDPPRMQSPTDFAPAVRWAARASMALGSRRMLWIDSDFTAWPLDDATLLDELTAWLRLPQRRLTLLAQSWDAVPRCQARFTAWRRTWSHAVDTLLVPEDESIPLTTSLLDDTRVSLRLLDPLRGRGRCSLEPQDAMLLHEQFDALAQRSTPGFPATPLGL
jgi:hypothetical protein